jgi:hypothetical protein
VIEPIARPHSTSVAQTSFFLRPYENNFLPSQDIEEILFGGDSSQKKKILHPARILNQAVISRLPAVHHPKFSKPQQTICFSIALIETDRLVVFLDRLNQKPTG